MNVLFVTGEAHPLIKTGGLADVCGALPPALRRLGADVRLLLPAYRGVAERAEAVQPIATLPLDPEGGGSESVTLLGGLLPGSDVPVYLLDAPDYFDRDGGPYSDTDGVDWPDNARRFALLARAAALIAQGRLGRGWRADVVHCHDWQAGLVPPLLSLEPSRPATVFTIHNLAYQGLFDWPTYTALGLPPEWWTMHALEFHGQLAFIKGGLVFADWLTTVSPTYAAEICTPQLGAGMDGVLTARADRLVGILNGADYDVWSPERDAHIAARYRADDLRGKAANKLVLQKRMGLKPAADTPLIGHVGRLVPQKGIDLLLDALPDLMGRDVQLAVVGSGDRTLQQRLEKARARHRGRLGVVIGYDEPLAHQLEAGADIFVMPSRFEPCGLNQIYSLRYGTLPVVRATGGLADTVVGADAETLAAGTATGFSFTEASATALLTALNQALDLHAHPETWRAMMARAMAADFSWDRSAEAYLALYRRAAGVA